MINKILRELNEEKTIIGLEWLWLSKSWKIKYSNNKYGWKDFNLIDFKENLQYLVNLKELVILNNYEIEILDLSNCINLEYLTLRNNNKIIEIKLPTENNFESLSIYNNIKLKRVNLEVLNSEFLKSLSLTSNRKLKLKTVMFSKFINLKELYVTNSNCSGSLFHLRNLIKLEFLLINNSKIIPSFEYLLDSVLISLSYNNANLINKFLTNQNNILLKRNMKHDEAFIRISEFKIKNPILIENARIIIQFYEYLIKINEDKKCLDNCLMFIINKKRQKIEFKLENETDKYFYSHHDRFNIIYTVFSEWIYLKNKTLNEYLNQKSNASLAYYVELLIEKTKRENPNLTNEKIQEIEYSAFNLI